MLNKKFIGELHINQIIGMEEKEAEEHLLKENKILRVINRDDRGLMVTMDHNNNRVNVFVAGGKVTYLDHIG